MDTSASRPLVGDPFAFASPLTDEQLTTLYCDPVVPLSGRIDRVCSEMLTYTVAIGWILRDTRNSGTDFTSRLATHLTKAYHRAGAAVPEDVTSALAKARNQRGPVSALVGADRIFSPSAVELLQDLHWKVHNVLVGIASPTHTGSGVLPTLPNGHPCGEAIFFPDDFSMGMMARWLIAARAEVVPVLIEWRAEAERLKAEVVWEQRLVLQSDVIVRRSTGEVYALPTRSDESKTPGRGSEEESDGNSEKPRKRKMSLSEADERARKLADERGSSFVMATSRVWAEQIGCSLGQIPKLPYWRLVQDMKEKSLGSPITVPLTSTIEATLGATDDGREIGVEDLIRQQDQDLESDHWPRRKSA